MKRITLFTRSCIAGGLALAVTGASACNRSETPAATTEQAGTSASANPGGAPEHGQDLKVTGCLTAGVDGRGFALTPSDSRPTEAGQALQMPGRETVTYELVGNVADFQGHANTIVTASGREDLSAAREAEVERKDEAQQPAAAGSRDTPTVETKEEVEVNVRRLHVSSVVATGQACPSTGAVGGRATEPATPARPGTPR